MTDDIAAPPAAAPTTPVPHPDTAARSSSTGRSGASVRTTGRPAATPTRPAATSRSAPLRPGQLPADTLRALSVALATEHAAVWTYGVVAAYDQADVDLVNDITSGHLARRDLTINLVTAGGGTPIPAAASYLLPTPVKDVATARAVATSLESDCAAAWRAVMGATDDQGLRNRALQGLSDSAIWLTMLKQAAKTTPVTVPFPGQS